MVRHLRHLAGLCLGFAAVAAEVTCYWLERASDRLYAAACGLTED